MRIDADKITQTLKNECKALEWRASKLKEIIQLYEQIVRFGIGIQELLAFHAMSDS